MSEYTYLNQGMLLFATENCTPYWQTLQLYMPQRWMIEVYTQGWD